MNTMLELTVDQHTENSSKVMQSLLLLVRNFLSASDDSLLPRHLWRSTQAVSYTPPRVWRRHSALLTLLAEQADTAASEQPNAE